MLGLSLVQDIAPWISIAVPFLGGLWAISRLRAPEVAARSDRSAALSIGAIMALGLGLLGLALGTAFTGFFGRPENPILGLLVGAVVAGLTFLGSLLGYALLVRRVAGRLALAGAILGPILVAGPLVATVSLQGASDRAQVAADVAASEDLGRKFFTLTVQDVGPIVDPQGQGYGSVEVHATLHATVDFELPSWNQPYFLVVPRNGEMPMAGSQPVGPVPGKLTAGSDLAVVVRFPATSLSPGAWRMRLSIGCPEGRCFVTAPLVIPG